jgi:hypothetical protein
VLADDADPVAVLDPGVDDDTASLRIETRAVRP